jgi:hypothetical protein
MHKRPFVFTLNDSLESALFEDGKYFDWELLITAKGKCSSVEDR